MLQPIVVQNDSLARGIEQAGDAFGNAIYDLAKERRQQNLYKQSGTILDEIIKKIPENANSQDYQRAIGEMYSRGISPDIIKQTVDLFKPLIKQREEMRAYNEMFGGSNPSAPLNQTMNSPQSMIFGAEGPLASQQSMIPQKRQLTPIETIKEGMNTRDPRQAFSMINQVNTASDSDLLKMASMPNTLANKAAKFEIDLRKFNQQKFNDERAYHAKGASEAEKEANILRASIRPKESSLKFAEESILTGETGPLSLANIAKRLNLPELMNAAGTQLTQAGKEFFFGTLSRVSAKAQNQFLEQRILSLMAEVGDPKINALMKTTLLRSEIEANKAYLREFDRIAKEDMEKYGYVRKDIQQRAMDASEDEHLKILNKTSYKARKLFEEEKGIKWLQENSNKKVENGTMATPTMLKIFANKYNGNFSKAIENMNKLGYTIPTQEEMQSWQ